MGAQDKEEILQAIDVLGGLLLEMNRRVNEQQTAQAEAFEEVTRSNETTKARLNALSEQVIALSDQMGVTGKVAQQMVRLLTRRGACQSRAAARGSALSAP